ncbi:diguanylate cyclase [Methylibium sp. T29]|uniref:GGDEF domain-containing protein n=1 Tax=Methylibium sp. T29 TaxID=1430884 RepID=UPI0003F3E14E|nr:diguanylate cyclase [Methylibium sp. T29]EWS53777.1 putative diguanylate cyclase AdrA [Methylibium sp. T29]
MTSDFTIHLPTLMLLAVVVMGATAAIMSVFGLSQRVYRGYWWWVGAMWLATLGAALHGLRNLWPVAVVPACLLVMVWPVLITTGLRRFFSRDRQFSSTRIDVALYVACYLGWLACWLASAPQPIRSLAYGAGSLILLLYAAVFIGKLDDFRRSPALKLLMAVMIVQAAVPMLRLAGMFSQGAGALPAQSLVVTGVVLPLLLSMLFTVYLCLVLTHERTVRDLRETQRQLRVLADIDMLTQVPNRRHFEELATAIVGNGAAPPSVLMLFDIDHFKHVNDNHGHAVGDAALRLVARCTRDTLRTRDVMGRVGGDEFMLLLPGASVDDALHVADRITRNLDLASKNFPLPLSLSFGWCRSKQANRSPPHSTAPTSPSTRPSARAAAAPCRPGRTGPIRCSVRAGRWGSIRSEVCRRRQRGANPCRANTACPAGPSTKSTNRWARGPARSNSATP